MRFRKGEEREGQTCLEMKKIPFYLNHIKSFHKDERKPQEKGEGRNEVQGKVCFDIRFNQFIQEKFKLKYNKYLPISFVTLI